MRSLQRLRSLPRPLGLGAREDRLPQPTELATPTLLRPQHHQVTSFEFYFQLGAPPQGYIIPRARGSVPAACIPFLFHVVSLPCWGRPSGCMIPKPHGPGPVACIPFAFISDYALDPPCLII